jgi:chromosome segregation ATPase
MDPADDPTGRLAPLLAQLDAARAAHPDLEQTAADATAVLDAARTAHSRATSAVASNNRTIGTLRHDIAVVEADAEAEHARRRRDANADPIIDPPTDLDAEIARLSAVSAGEPNAARAVKARLAAVNGERNKLLEDRAQADAAQAKQARATAASERRRHEDPTGAHHPVGC